jgi:hypothetical protein
MPSDDTKRFGKDQVSSSSPDYFRQDKKAERERRAKEATKDEKLARLKLQVQVEKQQREARDKKTGPAKEESQGKMESQEQAGSTKEFAERERKREEARQEAMQQGGPEEQSEDTA